ncbi:MAG: hypothetical protein V1721_09470 [Pseudomonadota bacterium]
MKKLGFAALVLAGLLCAACTPLYIATNQAVNSALTTSASWRYKMTVTVSTPEGDRTGSAVREVHAYVYPPNSSLLGRTGRTILAKGEAVTVDLGERGVLFAMTSGDYGWRVVYDAFPFTGYTPAETAGETIQYYSSLKNAKATLTPKKYPNFVRFRDLNNPKTIENIRRPDMNLNEIKKSDPRRPIIDFESAFGKGVNLKEVTIEMTDEPVTWGIEKYLPWVLTIGGGNLAGEPFSGKEWYQRLDKWEFKREQQ